MKESQLGPVDVLGPQGLGSIAHRLAEYSNRLKKLSSILFIVGTVI
jgi:hypothetical protein